MQEGSSQETITSNIKELLRSGKKPKEAIAMAIAEAHKFKTLNPPPQGEEPVTSGVTGALADALGGQAEAVLAPEKQLPESANQALSDDAKQAILDAKKKRNFTQG